MGLIAAVRQSRSSDGREAGYQAMLEALQQVGRSPVAFGWVIASSIFPIQQVLDGALDAIGDAPLLGFSSSGEITGVGRNRHSVVVALLAGEKIQSRANWWSDFTQDSRTCTQTMLHALRPDAEEGEILLVVADGISGDAAHLCEALSGSSYPLAGCLAGGELWRGRTYQLGGRQSGSGGLAAAVLSGKIVIGVGAAHGWQPVGAVARLTRVQGQWVRTLDEQPASRTYARFFGYPARQWAHFPLAEMVRLYPLGFQEGEDWIIRSPLRVEADGSLRMNTELPEGRLVNLLVGTQQGCLQATQHAARQALQALGSASPKLALLLVDTSWQSILELQPLAEIHAVREVLGEDIPTLGGYTYGQIVRLEPKGPASLLNQHILVILFGEKN